MLFLPNGMARSMPYRSREGMEGMEDTYATLPPAWRKDIFAARMTNEGLAWLAGHAVATHR